MSPLFGYLFGATYLSLSLVAMYVTDRYIGYDLAISMMAFWFWPVWIAVAIVASPAIFYSWLREEGE